LLTFVFWYFGFIYFSLFQASIVVTCLAVACLWSLPRDPKRYLITITNWQPTNNDIIKKLTDQHITPELEREISSAGLSAADDKF